MMPIIPAGLLFDCMFEIGWEECPGSHPFRGGLLSRIFFGRGNPDIDKSRFHPLQVHPQPELVILGQGIRREDLIGGNGELLEGPLGESCADTGGRDETVIQFTHPQDLGVVLGEFVRVSPMSHLIEGLGQGEDRNLDHVLAGQQVVIDQQGIGDGSHPPSHASR